MSSYRLKSILISFLTTTVPTLSKTECPFQTFQTNSATLCVTKGVGGFIMTEKSLYHTYVQNHNGLTGTSFVEGNEGLALGVSSSLIDDPGTNPEQFIAFALSTCFNATIRIVENREHTAADSQLRTRVDIEKDDIGYKFVVEAQIRMPEHTETEAQAIIDQALNECPVAKLLKENENVSFKLVDDFTDEPTYGE